MAQAEANQVLLDESAAPRRKKSGHKVLVASMVLVCGIGFGVWRIFFQSGSVNSAGQPQESSGRAVLPLESFTVNLADREDGRFLRTTLSLGVDGTLPTLTKPESKAVEAGGVSMATIRDSIITVLAQSKSNDLLTPEGKLKLKADLVSALNRDVPGLQAREVYFTEFLVQR